MKLARAANSPRAGVPITIPVKPVLSLGNGQMTA